MIAGEGVNMFADAFGADSAGAAEEGFGSGIFREEGQPRETGEPGCVVRMDEEENPIVLKEPEPVHFAPGGGLAGDDRK
jgi:hypothetical protein